MSLKSEKSRREKYELVPKICVFAYYKVSEKRYYLSKEHLLAKMCR